MLRALFEEMPGINPHDVTILIATGTHRANTPDELQLMLGADIVNRGYHIVNHNSRDDSTLAHVGETKAGVPIYLNKKWLAADVRITTGFVEPHFFAGFSGGAKMVAPGLAGLKTVLVLHDAKRIGSPYATWGVIEGNPIQDDVREIARTTGVTFSIDVTLNRDQQITAVFAGELFAEHGQACAFSKESVMCPVEVPFDVVLTTNSGYPLDQNLYQAVKGMSAAAKVVKSGGTIVCAAECRDGLPAHGSYGQVLASRPTPSALLEMINAPGLRRRRRVAGSGAGADPDESESARQERLHVRRRDPRRPFRTGCRRQAQRVRRARIRWPRGDAMRPAPGSADDSLPAIAEGRAPAHPAPPAC